jgi:hypothetical protein
MCYSVDPSLTISWPLNETSIDAAGALLDVDAAPPASPSAAAAAAAGALAAPRAAVVVQLCCDDLDCSEGSPAWPGDCAAKHDCGSLFCPAEAIDETTGLPFVVVNAVPECKNPAPPGEVCVCGCRCVCRYDSGRVVWLKDAPPPSRTPTPSAVAAVE